MLRLGKRPAKHNPHIPRLRALLARLETPPAELNWWSAVGEWPMLANDQLGDCVPAGALHLVQERLAYKFGAEGPTFSDSDAIGLYSKWGGYDPANIDSDQGCIMSDAMALWMRDGIPLPGGIVDRPTAIAALDVSHMTGPEDLLQWLRFGIWKFGGVLVGLQCPEEWVAEATPPYLFDLPKGLGAVAGGHCMLLNGAIPTGLGPEYDSITWGFHGRMTERALLAVVDEAYAVLDPDWMDAHGVDPAGIDWAEAKAAMQRLVAAAS